MPNMIRVLQLAKHFDPDTGGIETVTINISEVLLKHNIQADVLCTEVKGPYEERGRGYRVIRCKADLSFGNKRLSWQYLQQGRRLERDYDCAIVHIPNPLAVLAALNWKKPIIPLWHADIPQWPVRWASMAFDNWMLRKAATIIGPTPVHLKESRHSRAMVGRGVIIPYPFDQTMIPTATGQTEMTARLRAFRRGRAMSISVGRLVPYKGFDVLIDAARYFGDRLCALIVGSGPLHDELAEKIEIAGLADRVMLAGRLSSDELADAFAQATLGCMPSVTAAEMYGMSQVEAMAVGLPMVSTNIARSGVPFVNRDGETGLVVEPGNSKLLSAAMLRLVEDRELWQKLSRGAAESITRDHDINAVGERYAHLIRNTVLKANN